MELLDIILIVVAAVVGLGIGIGLGIVIRKGVAERQIKSAEQEATRIMDRANSEIELEKTRALDGMKQEMISIASMMAEKVVTAAIDTDVQESLIDETLKEIGESTWQN